MRKWNSANGSRINVPKAHLYIGEWGPGGVIFSKNQQKPAINELGQPLVDQPMVGGESLQSV